MKVHALINRVLQWREDIEGLDANHLRKRLPPSIRRDARSQFPNYSAALTYQVLAELNEIMANSISRLNASQPIIFKTGKTVQNNNLRFFGDFHELEYGKYALIFQSMETDERHLIVADYLCGRLRGKPCNFAQVSFDINKNAGKILADEAYRVYVLASLTPFIRCYDASTQSETPMLREIAQGEVSKYQIPTPQYSYLEKIQAINATLNPSQQKAAAAFLQLDHGLQMIMGPPGTGKTTTITSLLAAECHHGRVTHQKKTIVVCGSSNKSVEVIFRNFEAKHPNFTGLLLNGSLGRIDDASFKKADVLFSTLSGTARYHFKKNIKKIDVLLIDEAGQSSEPETLIPFQLKPQKVLLIGDVEQLQPTILSSNPEQMNHLWSMLWRLVKECNQQSHLLNTQYRMHPAISEFSRNNVYSGRVIDGVTSEQRTLNGIAPYEVIDVSGSQERVDGKKSYYNEIEAYRIIDIIKKFHCEHHVELFDIAVITPYKAQEKLITRLIEKEKLPEGVRVGSVDSFQGEESAVVLVSLVRSNELMRIGFLKKHQRINVAITRPRSVLRILMNGHTFNPLQPKTPFQNDFLQLFSTIIEIPSPQEENERDTFLKLSHSHSEQFSAVGYRASLQDYYGYYAWYDEYSCVEQVDKGTLNFFYAFDSSAKGYETIDSFAESRGIMKSFDGPKVIKALLTMLGHYTTNGIDGLLGSYPLFVLPNFPVKTHIVQDILDNNKVWANVPFCVIPKNTFSAIQYRTYVKSEESCEDYGDPFDSNDNYMPCGYSTGHYTDESSELNSRDLVFSNHRFIKCNLKDVDFHNSRFVNTTFDGSDLTGCRVNFENMDQVSKNSFQKNLRIQNSVAPPLLIELLLIDAKKRGFYREEGERVESGTKGSRSINNMATGTSREPRNPLISESAQSAQAISIRDLQASVMK